MNQSQLIKEMAIQDISHFTLKDRLRPYAFNREQVQRFIENGVPSEYSDYVRHVLGMSTTVGWTPEILKVKHKMRKVAPRDVVVKNIKRGKDHPLYKNGSSIAERNNARERNIQAARNVTTIRGVVKAFGGVKAAAEVFGCSVATINKMHVRRGMSGVFIPERYITPVVIHAMQNNISDVTFELLAAMLPRKTMPVQGELL